MEKRISLYYNGLIGILLPYQPNNYPSKRIFLSAGTELASVLGGANVLSPVTLSVSGVTTFQSFPNLHNF